MVKGPAVAIILDAAEKAALTALVRKRGRRKRAVGTRSPIMVFDQPNQRWAWVSCRTR